MVNERANSEVEDGEHGLVIHPTGTFRQRGRGEHGGGHVIDADGDHVGRTLCRVGVELRRRVEGRDPGPRHLILSGPWPVHGVVEGSLDILDDVHQTHLPTCPGKSPPTRAAAASDATCEKSVTITRAAGITDRPALQRKSASSIAILASDGMRGHRRPTCLSQLAENSSRPGGRRTLDKTRRSRSVLRQAKMRRSRPSLTPNQVHGLAGFGNR